MTRFLGLLNTRQKTAGGEGWKVYTEMTSENLTVAKRETRFLGGVRIWICRGRARVRKKTSEEENDAFSEKKIKTTTTIKKEKNKERKKEKIK